MIFWTSCTLNKDFTSLFLKILTHIVYTRICINICTPNLTGFWKKKNLKKNKHHLTWKWWLSALPEPGCRKHLFFPVFYWSRLNSNIFSALPEPGCRKHLFFPVFYWSQLNSNIFEYIPKYNCVASPFCQEGQSEEISWFFFFFLFLPDFSSFSRFFPLFLTFSLFPQICKSFSWFLADFSWGRGGGKGGTLPPGYATAQMVYILGIFGLIQVNKMHYVCWPNWVFLLNVLYQNLGSFWHWSDRNGIFHFQSYRVTRKSKYFVAIQYQKLRKRKKREKKWFIIFRWMLSKSQVKSFFFPILVD